MFYQKSKIKSWIAVVFFVLTINLIFAPLASAQFVVSDPLLETNSVKQSIWQKVWAAIKDAGLVALNNAAVRIGSEAGRNTANYIVSGGNGGAPMLLSKSPLEYATAAGEDALSDLAGQLNEDWSKNLGIDLCDPGVISLGLKVQLSFKAMEIVMPQIAKPKCEWQDVKKNWSKFVESATSKEYLEALMPQLKFENTDIGMLATFSSKADNIKNTSVSNVLSSLTGNNGFFGVKDKISGSQILPATDTEQKYIAMLKTDEAKRDKILENARNSQNPLVILVKSFWASMVNELQTKIVKILTGKAKRSTISGSESGLAQLNRARQAEAIFSELLTAEIKTGSTMDILGEFSACPSDNRYAQPNNCVIDQNFSKAITEKLTIKQAIEKGYLHGDWYVASPDEEDGADDYLGRYSLTNIKKLRKARIVPLGLEIAANIIYNKQVDKSNVTLNEIVNGYYNAGYDPRDPSTDMDDPVNNKWWHLVDPEWVLDAPEVRCAAQVYGSTPQSEASSRQEVCASWENCIYQDKNGSCLDWGYCLKEKLARDFGGKECSSQYASCRTYTRDSDGQGFAYLQKSLDFSLCDANNYGCYWYSTSKDAELTDWQSTSRVYLNHNVAECDSSEEGCSEFIELKKLATGKVLDKTEYDSAIDAAADSTSPVNYENAYNIVKKYIKKAPDYYNCYDTDLTNDAIKCSNYALACSSTEVGCQKYTPKDGSPWIPAIANDGDTCPAECNGYSTFLQKPLWWDVPAEGDDYLTAGFVNLISATAKKCSASQVGCEAYTNLSSGTESSENFSRAQNCQLPDNGLCQAYYTWQGSDTTGYQLKSYNLLKNSDDNNSLCTTISLPTSATDLLNRATCASTPVVESCYRGVCNNTGASCNLDSTCGAGGECFVTNPNCYEFYAAGDSAQIYYADITKVSTCTDSCSLYRKNRSDVTTDSERVYDEADCPAGHWFDGECLLTLDPIKSQTCSATSIGCREYAGSESGNIRRVFQENFEGDLNETLWQPGTKTVRGITYVAATPTIVAESVYIGGNSLKVEPYSLSAAVVRTLEGSVTSGKTYVLSFLAKGDTAGGSLYVEFGSGSDRFTEVVALTTDWNTYEVGPVSLDWTGDKKVTLLNDSSAGIGGSTFFLDNVTLKETNKNYYLIKDSWYTPAKCEVAPALSYGEALSSMLGCKQYTDESGLTVYLKSFTNLCSEDKVGCKILVDTKNSTIAKSQDFNRYTCVGGSNDRGRAYEACPEGEFCGADSLCQVSSGVSSGNSCDCPSGVATPNTGFDLLSISRDEAVYLVDDSNKYCNAQNKGCSLLGVPSFDTDNLPIPAGYGNTLLINNPDLYISTVDNSVSNPILCRESENKCEKFKTSTGSDTYFVDPEGLTCEYKEEVRVGSDYITGWFKTGVTNDAGIPEPCNCADTSDPDCYSEPPIFTSPDYNNRGAICPESEDMCTEFIDPMTTSSIYYVKNDDLTKNDCNGMVSEKTGCLLYSDTSVTNSMGEILNSWNAAATYGYSDTMSKAPVSPLAEPGPQTANIILQKKDANRACAEWLECNTWEYQWDNANSKYKKVCTGFGKCNKMNSNGSGCAVNGWVSTTAVGTTCTEGSHENDLVCLSGVWTPETLTKEAYQRRNITLNNFGAEYSGYSIFGLYPTETLQEKKYSDGLYYLSSLLGTSGVGLVTCTKDTDCSPRMTGQVCRDGECVIPKTCRGFPEADSPFDKNSTYTNVNKCMDEKKITDDEGYSLDSVGNGCNCHYTKSTYDGQVFYYDTNSGSAIGICTAGDATKVTAKSTCVQKSDCCDSGTLDIDGTCAGTGSIGNDNVPLCTYKDSEDTYYGWEGVCLEPDPSKTNLANNTFSCLTWFPSDKLASAVDLDNMSAGAGYRPDPTRTWYGVNEKSIAIGTTESGSGVTLSDGPILLTASISIDRPTTEVEDGRTNGFWQLNSEYKNKFKMSDIAFISVLLFADDGHDGGHSKWVRLTSPDMSDIDSAWWYGCETDDGNNSFCMRRKQAGSYLENPSSFVADGGDQDIADNGRGSIAVRASFDDSSDSFFTGLNWLFEDDNPSPCWGLCSAGHGTIEYLTIVLKNGAEYAVNIADLDKTTKAYTDRLWDKSKYFAENGTVEISGVPLECKPYGAIGNNDLTSWISANITTDSNGCNFNQAGVVYNIAGLQALFAETFGAVKFNYTDLGDDFLKYKTIVEPPESDYLWDTTDTPGNPLPTIESYSINGSSSGNVLLPDNNATAKFYAWANENHMPVTQVGLTWGDGFSGGSVANNMSAKNRKPVCEKVCTKLDAKSRIDIQSSTSCTSDADCAADQTCFAKTFGDTNDACVAGWWEYRHMYTCRDDMAEYQSTCSDSRVTGACCVFNPKVTVTDNWGLNTGADFGGSVVVPYTE